MVSGYEQVLVLQRTQILLPTLPPCSLQLGSLQLPRIPVEELASLSTCTHVQMPVNLVTLMSLFLKATKYQLQKTSMLNQTKIYNLQGKCNKIP